MGVGANLVGVVLEGLNVNFSVCISYGFTSNPEPQKCNFKCN